MKDRMAWHECFTGDDCDHWWLRLRFVEGGWELVSQTQDLAIAALWDDEIDTREARTGIEHEWLVSLPYGARMLARDA